MLYQTVQHPVIMYIAAAVSISKTSSLYQNYRFGKNKQQETQNARNSL
jgi:hypothetical protein